MFFNAILGSSRIMSTVFASHALQIVKHAPAKPPALHACPVSICLEDLVCFRKDAREFWLGIAINASPHAHLELQISMDSV